MPPAAKAPRSAARIAWSPNTSSRASLTASSVGTSGSSVRLVGSFGLSASAVAASSSAAAVMAFPSVNSVPPRVSAVIETSPPAPVTTPWSARRIAASTSLSTSLNASASPIETDTPTVPPSDAATDAAPAIALMFEESAATRVTVPA